VPTIEGKVKMKIPQGTQAGKIFRLRNKGIAHLHDRTRGDQLVKVQIDVPTDLNADQKKALRDFEKASSSASGGPMARSFVEKMRRMFR
jgi:molecular chaperone DnaJ